MRKPRSDGLSPQLWALVALLILTFAFQGSRGLFSPDEGYYVEVAREMGQTGDYLLPRLGSTPWLDKPPLSYWGIASGLYLLGNNEWGARAFHGLCYLLTTLLVYLLGRSLYGKRYAMWGGVIYSTMILPFVAANVVTTDTPLTLMTTAALYCFWKSLEAVGWHAIVWNNLMCAALGLAFLAKGPAALLPAAAIASFLVCRRQVRGYLVKTWAPVGGMVLCLVGFGWYAYVARQIPTAMEYMWSNQVVGRAFSPELARNTGLGHLLIYVPVVLVGALPWSAAWWSALRRGKKRLVEPMQWRWFSADPARLLLSTWIAIPLLLLSVASSRLPLYALPVFPALALATSRSLLHRPEKPTGSADSRGLSAMRIGFLILWVTALIGIRLVAAHIPHPKDMRALYASMEPYLPRDGPFEIVSVQEHLEGLAFYAPQDVERVTSRKKPYPFFIPPERLQEEFQEIADSSMGHVFVARQEAQVRFVRESLNSGDLAFEEANLPHGYRLFVVNPGSHSGVVRLIALGDFGAGPARSSRLTISSAIHLLEAEKSLEGVVILSDRVSRTDQGDEDLAFLVSTKVQVPFASILKEQVPIHLVLGGNEQDSEAQPFELEYGSLRASTSRNYSSVLGGGLVELFVLHSDEAAHADPEQLAWLSESLLASKSLWKIVATYQPFDEGSESVAAPSDSAARLKSILAQGDVDLVLQGHGLHYERYQGMQGITYVSPGSRAAASKAEELLDCREGAFCYDKMQVFVLVECGDRNCRLAAYNGLGAMVDEATVEHPTGA